MCFVAAATFVLTGHLPEVRTVICDGVGLLTRHKHKAIVFIHYRLLTILPHAVLVEREETMHELVANSFIMLENIIAEENRNEICMGGGWLAVLCGSRFDCESHAICITSILI